MSTGINRERRKRKGADGSKKKKTKKAKTDKKNAPDTPALSQEDERTVLESFQNSTKQSFASFLFPYAH